MESDEVQAQARWAMEVADRTYQRLSQELAEFEKSLTGRTPTAEEISRHGTLKSQEEAALVRVRQTMAEYTSTVWIP